MLSANARTILKDIDNLKKHDELYDITINAMSSANELTNEEFQNIFESISKIKNVRVF